LEMPDRNSRYYLLTVLIAAALVYWLTACRTVFVGDSGELTVVLSTGGIAHPPGYPLYTILGFLWLKLLPIGNTALAANLFSAAAAIAASIIIYKIVQKVALYRHWPVIPSAFALIFAFSYPVWSSATNAEVYAFSGLLYLAAFFAVISFFNEGGSRMFILAGFLGGLTLTHHFSAGIVIAMLVVAAFYRKRSLTSGTIISAVIALILPLFLYLYLLWRFRPDLPINWMSDGSFSALRSLIGGEIYRQFVGWPNLTDLWLFMKKTTVAAWSYFGPGLIILAVPGMVVGFVKRRRYTILLLVPMVLNLLLVAAYRIPDNTGYLLPFTISTLFFMFFFLEWLWVRNMPGKTMTMVICVVLIAIPLGTNYVRCDWSRFDLARYYGRHILDSAGKNGVVFLRSDNGAHTALYLRYVENYRPDLTVYATNGTMTRLLHHYGLESHEEVMDYVGKSAERAYWGTEYIINQGMNPVPGEKSVRGILFGRPGDNDDEDVNRRIAAYTQDTLPKIDLNGELKARQIYLEYQLHRIDRKLRAGNPAFLSQNVFDLLRWGQRLEDPMTILAVAQYFRSRGSIERALKWVDLARQADPYTYEEKDIYVGLGTIYRQAGDLALAGQALSKALRIDPGYNPARYNANLVKAEKALQRQDWREASEAFLTLTEIEPDNPLPYFNLGVIYEKWPGHNREAVRYFELFLERAGEEHYRAVEQARLKIDEINSAGL